MNAHIFDSHSAICPICHRARGIKPSELDCGLYTCHHCQERLVVSGSGHYVRDPFSPKHLSSRLLRRQSRPFARLLRDFGIAKPPSFIVVMGSLVMLSLALASTERLKGEETPIHNWIDQVKERIDRTWQQEADDR